MQFPGTCFFLVGQQEILWVSLGCMLHCQWLESYFDHVEQDYYYLFSQSWKQSLSNLALWIFGLDGSLQQPCPLLCRMFSSTPRLTHQMPHAPFPEPPSFQTLPHVPWEQNCTQLRTMALKELKKLNSSQERKNKIMKYLNRMEIKVSQESWKDTLKKILKHHLRSQKQSDVSRNGRRP